MRVVLRVHLLFSKLYLVTIFTGKKMADSKIFFYRSASAHTKQSISRSVGEACDYPLPIAVVYLILVLIKQFLIHQEVSI